MVAKFGDQMGTIGHLESCAEYLAARGLDFKELPIVTSLQHDAGFYQRINDQWFKLPLDGWAFRIRDKWGELLDGCFLLRPQWPDGEVYQRDGAEYALV